MDPDGTGVIGDIEADHPGVALFQFLVVDGKDLALHDDAEHIQGQILHGRHFAPERFAVNDIGGHIQRRGAAVLLLALVLVRRRGQFQFGHSLRPEAGRFREQVRVIGQTAPLHVNLYVPAEPVLEIADGGGQMGQEVVFTVGPQMDRQLVPLQRPVGSGQGGGRHGIDPV